MLAAASRIANGVEVPVTADAHTGYTEAPISVRSVACSVGSRLAACSQTIDDGPSMTSAVTSSPRVAAGIA